MCMVIKPNRKDWLVFKLTLEPNLVKLRIEIELPKCANCNVDIALPSLAILRILSELPMDAYEFV